MSEFRVGDLVECINAKSDFGKVWLGTPPILGGLYTIAHIMPDPLGRTLWAFALREISNGFAGYKSERFRLVHKPRADFIEALKALPIGELVYD